MKTYLNINSIQDKSIPGSKLEESYVSQENGKGLSTNDFTDILKNKLLSLNNYDDSELNEKILKLEQNLNSILGEGSTEAIENFNEIISFLSGIEDSESLDNIIAAIELQISDKQDKINDLQKIREGASKGETALQEIPEEYITEYELENKGYLTEHQDITPEILQNENEVAIKVGNNTSGYTTINYSKFSNDLTGRIEATPEEFTFRPSTGDKSIRDESALIKKIKGNTIVWNQLGKDLWEIQNGDGTRENNNYIISTISGQYPGIKCHKGSVTPLKHKILVTFRGRIEGYTNPYFHINYQGSNNATISYTQPSSGLVSLSAMFTCAYNTNAYCIIFTGQNATNIQIVNPQIFDLTQMFGAGNEPATVEEFKALFPDSYYPYCEPELRSVTTKAIETVGFNQWDEEWEEGMYNINTGEKQESSNIQVRSKNYIKVLPNTDYFFDTPNDDTGWGWVIFYDEDKNFISSISIHHNMRTTPANASFATFHMNGSYGTTYNNDICINLSHSGVRNGEYQPYEKHTRELPEIAKYFPNGMRSAGSTYDEIRYNDATEQWEAVQRVGAVDLGNFPFNLDPDGYFKGYITDGISQESGMSNIVCVPYKTVEVGLARYQNKTCSTKYVNVDYPCQLQIKDDSYTDATSFKAAMSGVMLYYELAEPIITPIEEPIQMDYWVEDFGTEEAISDTPSAPFKADVVYQFNAEGRIRDNSRNIERLEDIANDIKEDINNVKSTYATKEELYNSNLWYGIEWDTTISTPACTRIGDMNLHRTLPIQSNMKGCLLDDNGNVVTYLDDWLSATRDGSMGQVMVEIPMHYRKFEEEGTVRRCKISTGALPDFHLVPKVYISAYEATVQRSTTKLCSVVNTDADYRGGNNNSSWDGTYKTLLGRPATGISLTNFRNYARKRNTNTTEWNCNDYNAYKILFWLYYIEYANKNCQLAFNSEKDSNGYAQGGLGSGVTTLSDSQWSGYNSYYPFVPCGYTDSFGNNSGVLSYDLMQEDGTTLTTVSVNRYRGIELPFGHVWKWTDGISIKMSPTAENGGTGESEIYVANATGNYNSTNYNGYTVVGLEARSIGYVKELVFGAQGDIMPALVGGSSTTYWADYHYTKIPTSEALRGVLFGGSASFDAQAGFMVAYSSHEPSYTHAAFGSRICFIPRARLQE